MSACQRCGKGKNTVSFSRHKKGSSGAGGTWALRAPVHKRVQKPNLHQFKGKSYCTKCLRIVKKAQPAGRQVMPVQKRTVPESQDIRLENPQAA